MEMVGVPDSEVSVVVILSAATAVFGLHGCSTLVYTPEGAPTAPASVTVTKHGAWGIFSTKCTRPERSSTTSTFHSPLSSLHSELNSSHLLAFALQDCKLTTRGSTTSSSPSPSTSSVSNGQVHSIPNARQEGSRLHASSHWDRVISPVAAPLGSAVGATVTVTYAGSVHRIPVWVIQESRSSSATSTPWSVVICVTVSTPLAPP
mmetsp:Transcript_81122/g.216732  ORF Transcript_81122/g.216732 Transcript_81122/m.216732 type:complete len:205 (-) Transcript_81122:2240-2854(-)